VTDFNRSIPTFAPAICQLKPRNAATFPVSPEDVARWRLIPEELVGKCFVTTEEIMRRTFLVQDYYVKRNGPHYEVVFEDTGLDVVQTLHTNTLLAMVMDAELVV
jgi:hypothetical protein